MSDTISFTFEIGEDLSVLNSILGTQTYFAGFTPCSLDYEIVHALKNHQFALRRKRTDTATEFSSVSGLDSPGLSTTHASSASGRSSAMVVGEPTAAASASGTSISADSETSPASHWRAAGATASGCSSVGPTRSTPGPRPFLSPGLEQRYSHVARYIGMVVKHSTRVQRQWSARRPSGYLLHVNADSQRAPHAVLVSLLVLLSSSLDHSHSVVPHGPYLSFVPLAVQRRTYFLFPVYSLAAPGRRASVEARAERSG
jgi:hypothetical protein